MRFSAFVCFAMNSNKFPALQGSDEEDGSGQEEPQGRTDAIEEMQ